MPTVAILGRPNVGKSTLFNRLCGLRVALVDPTPGVTRDRRSGLAKLGDLEFDVIDTAGLDDAEAGTMEASMQQQTERRGRPSTWRQDFVDVAGDPTWQAFRRVRSRGRVSRPQFSFVHVCRCN